MFYVCYLDNVLIYSETLEDHDQHIQQVLTKLHKVRLYVKLEKYKFRTTKTIFLGFVISYNRIEMDSEKVSAIMDCEKHESI